MQVKCFAKLVIFAGSVTCMTQEIKININDFSYPLSDERIAKYPLHKRDESKLLILNSEGDIKQDVFYNISEYLPENSLLIYNNTRVIHARLKFKKKTGARIEIFCLTPFKPREYQIALSSISRCTWECMIGNLKKWKDEILESTISVNNKTLTLKAKKIVSPDSGSQRIEFTWDGNFTFAQILEAAGKIPIPPYLSRDSEIIDEKRYQTIYSKPQGSVAAPTAGLHFTPDILKKIQSKQISTAEVTLHVGAGTFQPVKSEDAREHAMHSEQVIINKTLLEQIINNPGKLIAVGTTSLRTLESIYWLGVKAFQNKPVDFLGQWEWESLRQKISLTESLEKLYNLLDKQKNTSLSFKTEIMIVPGYRFRVTDGIITNFHQPKSTLLLLIAAFIGEDWKKVYNYALRNDFRFLSYGDSSLLLKGIRQ